VCVVLRVSKSKAVLESKIEQRLEDGRESARVVGGGSSFVMCPTTAPDVTQLSVPQSTAPLHARAAHANWR
jgi:hypothetical protein